MLTRNPEISDPERTPFNDYPFFVPRCWHAMSVSKWARYLRENDFQFDRYPMVIGVSICAPFVSVANRIQHLLHWRRAAATPREFDPIFVIGHWRTGTTFLQNLLGLDHRMRTPDTLECLSPENFLVTRWIFPHLLNCPSRRPMDNMSMGWTKPQEDEFVFCVRGAMSVYRNFGFPHRPDQHLESLTMEDVSSQDLAIWKTVFQRFVTYLNYQYRKPLIFKSPTHTGRIQLLLEMFPNAKFIHMTRDPYDFIPSTCHLWRSLEATSGFQRDVSNIDHQDYVFNCFHRMYDSFERRKHLIPTGNLCEVNYDQITGDTVHTMSRIYQELNLGDFSEVQPAIESNLESERDYRPNQHYVPSQLKNRIESECSEYIANYCRPLPRRIHAHRPLEAKPSRTVENRIKHSKNRTANSSD